MERRIVLVLAFSLLAAPAALAAMTPAFTEDWETGSDGWTAEPGVLEVRCAEAGCHAQVIAHGFGAYVGPSRDLDVAPSPLAVVSTLFLGTRTEGHTDAAIVIPLDVGGVMLELTAGAWELGENNQVRVWSVLFDEPLLREPEVRDAAGRLGLEDWIISRYTDYSPTFATWSDADVWYQAKIHLDFALHTVRAELYDTDGNKLGESQPLPIPRQATRLESIQLETVSWASSRADVEFGFDDLRIETLG